MSCVIGYLMWGMRSISFFSGQAQVIKRGLDHRRNNELGEKLFVTEQTCHRRRHPILMSGLVSFRGGLAQPFSQILFKRVATGPYISAPPTNGCPTLFRVLCGKGGCEAPPPAAAPFFFDRSSM